MYICSSCLSVLDSFSFNASVFFSNVSRWVAMSPMTNLVAIQTSLGPSRDLGAACYDPYNSISFLAFLRQICTKHAMIPTTSSLQLRQCRYAMLQLTPCSTKRRTLWKQPVTCPYWCISHFELQVRIVNHAQNTRWGVRMRYEEYAIRYYQMRSDSYQMLSDTITYHHICYIRKHVHSVFRSFFSDSGTMMFTHRNPEALGGGEFFGRVAFRIIHKGQRPRQERQELPAWRREISLDIPCFWWLVYQIIFWKIVQNCINMRWCWCYLMLFIWWR